MTIKQATMQVTMLSGDYQVLDVDGTVLQTGNLSQIHGSVASPKPEGPAPLLDALRAAKDFEDALARVSEVMGEGPNDA